MPFAKIGIMKVEIIPHTADMGLLITARTLKEAFQTSALAVSSLLVRGKVRCLSKRIVELKEPDRESLFVNFLNEIIFLFDAQRFAVGEIRISKLGKRSLKAELLGERFSLKRHTPGIPVKAATYYSLKIFKEGRFWKIRVIFDV